MSKCLMKMMPLSLSIDRISSCIISVRILILVLTRTFLIRHLFRLKKNRRSLRWLAQKALLILVETTTNMRKRHTQLGCVSILLAVRGQRALSQTRSGIRQSLIVVVPAIAVDHHVVSGVVHPVKDLLSLAVNGRATQGEALVLNVDSREFNITALKVGVLRNLSSRRIAANPVNSLLELQTSGVGSHVQEAECFLLERHIRRLDNGIITSTNQTIIGLELSSRISDGTNVQLMELSNCTTSTLIISHREFRTTGSRGLTNDIDGLNIVVDFQVIGTDIINTRIESQELILNDVLIGIDQGSNLSIRGSHLGQEIRDGDQHQIRIALFIQVELLELSPVRRTTEQGIASNISGLLQTIIQIILTHTS
nr:MAG TPA: hypothetical protein [Caudoviricetes sp.]